MDAFAFRGFSYCPNRRQNPASLRALIDLLRTRLKVDARAIATPRRTPRSGKSRRLRELIAWIRDHVELPDDIAAKIDDVLRG